MNLELTQTNVLTTHGEGVLKKEEEEEMMMIKALSCQDLPREQTHLHFLLQRNEQDSLTEIVEEAVKKQDLDHQGNTVPPVAAANKSFRMQLAKLSLAGAATATTVDDVNGEKEKEKGETVLEICRALPGEAEIGCIILEAGAQGGGADEPLLPTDSSYGNKSLAHSSPEVKAALLVVLVLFVGASLGVVSNPPPMVTEARQKLADGAAPAAYRFSDVIRASMPAPFYLLVGSTAVFTSSMGYIAVILYYLPYTAVLHFAGIMVAVVYFLFLDGAVPRYKMKIRSQTISASVFVWMSALTLLFCGLIVVTLLKNVCSFVFNIASGLIKYGK